MTTQSDTAATALTLTRQPTVVGVAGMALSLSAIGASCTVRVIYGSYEKTDRVVVNWTSGPDGKDYQASNPTLNADNQLEFSVPIDIVKANVGLVVRVGYTVTRGTQTGTSSEAIFKVKE